MILSNLQFNNYFYIHDSTNLKYLSLKLDHYPPIKKL